MTHLYVCFRLERLVLKNGEWLNRVPFLIQNCIPISVDLFFKKKKKKNSTNNESIKAIIKKYPRWLQSLVGVC